MLYCADRGYYAVALRLEEGYDMAEIIFAALFCFSMVFALLGALYALIKLSTGAIKYIEEKMKK